MSQKSNAITVELSSCKSFTFPQTYFETDGLHHELRPDDPNKIWFEYQFQDGERQGPIKIFAADGTLLAECEFFNNRLKNETLWLYENGQKHELKLDYDCPGWFFHENWSRKSGPIENEKGELFIWIAGQRYRLPDSVVEINL